MKIIFNLLLVFFLVGQSTAHDFFMGGGQADTDVVIEGLIKTVPSSKKYKEFWLNDDIELPGSYRGRFAEDIADDFFLNHINTKLGKSKPGYRFVRCGGKYDNHSDNGYDGFYILLDNKDKIAKFSEENNIVKSTHAATFPVIILNESKYDKNGSLRFGGGINGSLQMSEAWVRYVAHNIILNRDTKAYVESCPVTQNSKDEVICEHGICKIIKDGILREIVESNMGLRRVFRLATVLNAEKKFSFFTLYDSDAMRDRTEALLDKLLA